MDLDALVTLCAVADAGSLSAASSRLDASQPTVSRRIQRLEAELGTALLARGGRGVRLTAAGELTVAFARTTLAAHEQLRSALAEGRAPLRGSIRIIASTTTGDYLVPELVARFTERHPQVRADVVLADSAAVPGALLTGHADVGFSGRKNPDRRLVHTPIARDEIVLAAPADHPFAASGHVPLEALADERLIWREDGSGTQRTFMEALAARGVELPPGSASASLGSTQAVVSAVAAGLGVGVVSIRALRHHEGVVAVRVDGLPIVRDLWLVHEADVRRAAHLEAFLGFVAQAAGRPGARG